MLTNKYGVKILVALLAVAFIVSCDNENDPKVLPPPTITSYSPESALIGTAVTINGTNFGTDIDNVTVYFYEDEQAEITAITNTQLTVTVPNDAYVGTIRVVVGDNEVEGGEFEVLTICTVFIGEFPSPFPCPRYKSNPL